MDTLIDKILSNYNIKGYTLEENQGDYIVHCNDETFLLNVHNSKRASIKDLLQFYEDIYSNGFRKLGKIIKTNNGNNYIKGKNKSYFLTSYFKEDKSITLNMDFFKSSTNLLNNFHKCTLELSPEKYNLKKNYSKYIKRYLKRTEYLLSIKYDLSNNVLKSPIDNMILQVLITYDDLLNHLKTTFLNLNTNINKSSPYVFSLGEMSLEDFGKVKGKLRLKKIPKIKNSYYHLDVGSLLHKILNNPDVNWDYKAYKTLIEPFKSDGTHSLEDIYLFLGFTLFPYKLYDICRGLYKRRYLTDLSKEKLSIETLLIQRENILNWFNLYVEEHNI